MLSYVIEELQEILLPYVCQTGKGFNKVDIFYIYSLIKDGIQRYMDTWMSIVDSFGYAVAADMRHFKQAMGRYTRQPRTTILFLPMIRFVGSMRHRQKNIMSVCSKLRNYFAAQVSLRDVKSVVYRITKHQSFTQTYQLLLLIQKQYNAIVVHKIKFHVEG